MVSNIVVYDTDGNEWVYDMKCPMSPDVVNQATLRSRSLCSTLTHGPMWSTTYVRTSKRIYLQSA